MSVVFLTRTRVLKLGEIVYLVQPTPEGVRQIAGYVTRFETGRFVLRLDEGLHESDGRFVFAVNDEQVRLVSTGVVHQLAPLTVSCRPLSPWQEVAVERRVAPRYATALKAVLSSEADGPAAGTIVNISEGGCDFATDSAVQGTKFDLLVPFGTFSSQISCVRVGEAAAEGGQGRRVLHHLAFRSVNPSQRAFLRMILDDHKTECVEIPGDEREAG